MKSFRESREISVGKAEKPTLNGCDNILKFASQGTYHKTLIYSTPHILLHLSHQTLWKGTVQTLSV